MTETIEWHDASTERPVMFRPVLIKTNENQVHEGYLTNDLTWVCFHPFANMENPIEVTHWAYMAKGPK